jgi:branched-chain amino acid transport system permease protein
VSATDSARDLPGVRTGRGWSWLPRRPDASRFLAPPAYRGYQWPFLGLVLVVGAVVPLFFGGTYYADGILNQALINAVLALGFYWCFSLGGQFTFGTFATFAAGAYVSVWGANHVGGGFWGGFALAVLVTGGIGALTRLVFFKLGPIYFAIATLAVGGLILILFREWVGFTGGYNGVGHIAIPDFFGTPLNTLHLRYYLMLGVLGVCLAATVALIRSSAMRDLVFSRDKRAVAATAGIRPAIVTLIVFTVGSAMMGAAGSLYAHNGSFFSLEAFDVSISLNVLLMVLLGGSRSIYGALIGASLLVYLPELLRSVQSLSGLIYAGLVLVIIVLFPDGIIAERWIRARRG